MSHSSRHIEEKIDELQDYIRLARRDTKKEPVDQTVSQIASDFTGWLKHLNFQLNPSGEATGDPAADIVVNGLRELKEGAIRTLEQTAERPEVIACCLLNAVFTMAQDKKGRAVTVKEYRRYLQALHALVRFIRHTVKHRDVEILGLDYDLSDLFDEVIRTAQLAPMVVLLFTLEITMDILGKEIYKALQKIRCLPLLDLWALVMRWLYNRPLGFVYRMRSHIRSEMLRIRRQTLIASGRNSFSLDDASANLEQLGVSTEDLDRIEKVLERLVLAIGTLAYCPLPEDGAEEESGRRARDAAPRGPTSGGDGGRRPTSGRGATSTREEERTGSRDERSGGGSAGIASSGASSDDPREEVRERYRRPDDDEGGLFDTPDGYQTYYGDLPEGDWVFLTQQNLTRMFVDSFGLEPEAARGAAKGGSCRDDLSDSALEALNALGLNL